MPADLVGTRVLRAGGGGFDTELGPVFANFLLADEINRAPAKVQSALLEVMQEGQVTIGGETHQVPRPFIVMATQNPIESEGTYPLPEAQLDRFLMKILVDYPTYRARRRRWSGGASPHRSGAGLPGRRATCSATPRRCAACSSSASASATRSRWPMRPAIPSATACAELGRLIEFGSSPRGPIGLIDGARVLALLRGRGHVVPADVRDLAHDVLRHRIVLSYDALSDGLTADALLDRILAAVPEPGRQPPRRPTRRWPRRDER